MTDYDLVQQYLKVKGTSGPTFNKSLMKIVEDYQVIDADNYTKSVFNGTFKMDTVKDDFDVIHKLTTWIRNDPDRAD